MILLRSGWHCTKIKFSIKNFFCNCDQILRKLWIWSHLRKKSLIETLIFNAMWDQIRDFLLRLEVLYLRNESHIDFRTQSVIMTLGGGEVSLMTFWNPKKLSSFKAHELRWTVNYKYQVIISNCNFK